MDKRGTMAMTKGTIKRIKVVEGFGFISGEDGQDYFFHRSGLDGDSVAFEDLKAGDHVEFEPTAGVKGPRAENVQLVRIS